VTEEVQPIEEPEAIKAMEMAGAAKVAAKGIGAETGK
jgi:hypothetical protein